MNIPDTDEDLLAINTEKLDSILEDRDEAINNQTIPELIPDKRDHYSKPVSLTDRLYSSTAYDRILAVFSTDPVLSEQELNKVGRRARKIPVYLGISIGMITGVMRAFVSYDEFLRANKYTIFANHKMAMRHSLDHCILRGIIFGISVGSKVTLLTGGYYTLPLLFSAIQGKTSYWEHAAGWGITSSLYCLNRGFKRMLIAGMIGSVPGLLTGVLSMLACRMSNSTFEELYAKHLNETQKI
ncbi:unnamed protein product [Schistosoma rodhaini]|uniref:Complex I assembly factor TIMMDC1, mitochondrial n=1 Tax=Schistosoma rodhaini TaxID=6188 RepID=A0AA85FWX4_9TREM|nr:unnamed protein product [Schistosoma rodhaini]CAH8565919.1 unnamed protein product [Schistosoma rodhaini]